MLRYFSSINVTHVRGILYYTGAQLEMKAQPTVDEVFEGRRAVNR